MGGGLRRALVVPGPRASRAGLRVVLVRAAPRTRGRPPGGNGAAPSRRQRRLGEAAMFGRLRRECRLGGRSSGALRMWRRGSRLVPAPRLHGARRRRCPGSRLCWLSWHYRGRTGRPAPEGSVCRRQSVGSVPWFRSPAFVSVPGCCAGPRGRFCRWPAGSRQSVTLEERQLAEGRGRRHRVPFSPLLSLDIWINLL